jgi:hypothetical protein
MKKLNKTMSKKSTTSTNSFLVRQRIKRKGVHSKKKNSKNKRSKNYRKAYVGQGK